jgi:hypothetical protein
MWAILPDARSKSPEFLHYPIVLFNAPARDGSDWCSIRNKLNLKNTSNHHAWLLDGEDILIPHQNQAQPIKVKSEAGIKGYPNASNARDFSWVPRVQEVFSKCANMEPRLTPDDPRLPLPSMAAARMLISQGQLETATFVKYVDPIEADKIVEFEFFPGGDVGRALAELLVATIPLDAPKVKIMAYNHNTKKERSIELDVVDGYVDILVANASPISDNDKPMDGRHFSLYYHLSTQPGEVGPIPKAIAKKEFGDDIELPYPPFIDYIHVIKKSGETRPICTSSQFN